jgi:hypothetical protein
MYAAVASATGGTACSQPLSTLTGTSSAKAALQPQQKNKRRRGVIGTEGLFTGYRIQDTGYRIQEPGVQKFRSSEWAGAALLTSDF